MTDALGDEELGLIARLAPRHNLSFRLPAVKGASGEYRNSFETARA
jgi:hypothetical protein